MAKDKEFLKQCELMDYSLLLVYYRKPDDMSFEESVSDESSDRNRNSIDKSPIVIPGNN